MTKKANHGPKGTQMVPPSHPKEPKLGQTGPPNTKMDVLRWLNRALVQAGASLFSKTALPCRRERSAGPSETQKFRGPGGGWSTKFRARLEGTNALACRRERHYLQKRCSRVGGSAARPPPRPPGGAKRPPAGAERTKREAPNIGKRQGKPKPPAKQTEKATKRGVMYI